MSIIEFKARLKEIRKSYWHEEIKNKNDYNRGWADCLEKVEKLMKEEKLEGKK